MYLRSAPPAASLQLAPTSLLPRIPPLTYTEPPPPAPLPAGTLALLEAARALALSPDDVPAPQARVAPPPADDRALHAPGSNQPGLLAAHVPDELLAAPPRRGDPDRVLPSLAQPAFALADVFDPGNGEDTDLFGVGGEESSAGSSSEEEDGEGVEDGENGEEVGGGVTLDEELDAVLGGPGAFWNASKEGRARLRLVDPAKGGSGDVWAVHDDADVSDFGALVPDPALEYPFELDVFQRRAVSRLERGENVFVAAHTSAGKTVVAEYAIAMALRNRTRVVYTSPIKTLSNQKFRDFSDRFGEVGLITGDVSLNPDAPVLVMTTEILRSMLYRGADLIRDLEFVIFDEVHWASDPERGVVWEESIILLPEACGIVMLSATVPNALEFAAWVGRTKRRMVYVVSTHTRPVPLKHSLHVRAETFPLLETTRPSHFLTVNYKAAVEKFNTGQAAANAKGRGGGRGGARGGRGGGGGGRAIPAKGGAATTAATPTSSSKTTVARVAGASRHHTWSPLIKYLRKNELDPALIFCFSKRKCEEAADSLYSTDLTAGATERNQIHHFYTSSISRLSAADRRVPQISRCLDSLKRGIGVHHAGILPIVKEATEVLFQRGLVRVLFCTETFAVGVNAPARTVVFSAIKKFDGETLRALEPGEYVQMAGRAGRRGKDTVGMVLLYPAPADFPSEIELKTLLMGSAKRMKSQFRLTYNMILNLMRVDELRVEDVMSRSFSEAPAGRNTAQWKKLVDRGEAQLKELDARAHELDAYRTLHELLQEVRAQTRDLAPVMSEVKKNNAAAFSAGRVLVVDRADGGLALAVITKSAASKTARLGFGSQQTSTSTRAAGQAEKLCQVAVLYGGAAIAHSRSAFIAPHAGSTDTAHAVGGVELVLRDVTSAEVHGVTLLTLDVDERGLNPLRGAPTVSALSSTASQLLSSASDAGLWASPPLATAGPDVRVADAAYAGLWAQRNASLAMAVAELGACTGGGGGGLAAGLCALAREARLRRKVGALRAAASDESLQLMPDFRQRVEVLRRLGYVDGGSVLLKGRAMCEVNCCELILVELAFENALQNMSPPGLAAVLSALVFQGGGGPDDAPDTPAALARLAATADEVHAGCAATARLLHGLGALMAAVGLPASPADYAAAHADYGLVDAVYAWAQGAPFADVCARVPHVAEGSIVRAVVRLCELLREARNVGRLIGDAKLAAVAEAAAAAVRRDVIFAASLYVS